MEQILRVFLTFRYGTIVFCSSPTTEYGSELAAAHNSLGS